jgi:ubiquitin carboxyl-terminal hydrolase 35/38
MKSTLKCLKCRSESSRTEMFTDLPLAFPDYNSGTAAAMSLAGGGRTRNGDAMSETTSESSSSGSSTSSSSKSGGGGKPLHLNDLVEHFLRAEKLTGDNLYYCDRCGGLQEGERTMKIVQSPEYLILTLLRFAYDTKSNSRSKIFREVKYPKTLVVPVESSVHNNKDTTTCASKSQQSTKSSRRSIKSVVVNRLNKCGLSLDFPQADVYGLCGVVIHSGTSSDCGHYYSYGRHSLLADPHEACRGLADNCRDEDAVDFLQVSKILQFFEMF